MKVKLSTLMLVLLFAQGIAQVSTPFNNGVPANFVGWGPGNPFPLRIEHQGNQPINFGTTNFPRMILDNGPGNQTGGRLALGNNLPIGFAPVDRLHLHHVGFNNLNTYMRFTNSLTGAGATNGFAIGNTSNGAGNGVVNMFQFQQEPIIMHSPNAHSLTTVPREWFRLANGQTFALPVPGRSTDGFIGLNQPNPRSHIDMVTPAISGGEEFIMAKPDDIYAVQNVPASGPAPNVQMGMMNLTGLNGQFLPGVYGNLNQNSQNGAALQMLGCIHNSRDLFALEPIMRFMVGRNWFPNGNTPLPTNLANQAIANRPIFSWQNADIVKMYMSAQGRVRLGDNLTTGPPPIPDNVVNNRFEITAAPIDPYFNPAGGPANPNWSGATFGGASGLRFTFLRSVDLVQVPTVANGINPGNVLTTDRNGDVVMINTLGNANNGLSVVNGTLVQLGATCGSATVALAQLLNNREVPLNNNNFIFSGLGGTNNRVGIGTGCNPGNKLEINNGVANTSGLRFTQLTSLSPTQVNPGPGVLTVDPFGDVIYVTSPATTFGNLCTAAVPSALTGNFQMPLGTFQYKFTGQGLIDNVTKEDIVSVGYPCNVNPPSRFSVLENQTAQPTVQTYAGHFNNNNASTPIFTGIPIETAGLFAECKRTIVGPPNYVNHNIGAIGEATGSINSIGVVGRIAKSSLPIGTLGQGRYAIGGAFMSDTSVTNIPSPSVENYGVFASAFNSPVNNFAVYAETGPDPNGIASSYGIFARTTGPNPTFPGLAGNYAGYFDGDVVVNGAFAITSDANLKQNFDSIPNALQIINQLKPKTFDYKINQYPQMALPQGLQYGLVAQEVNTVVPAIVSSARHPETKVGSTTYPAFTYSTVEYQSLIPILIRAVQQLSAQNHKLDSLITALTQTVSSCCSNSAAKQTGINGNDPNALSQINVNLSDIDMIVLDQNKPNPFAEQTTITYNVPEKYGFAQLVFKTIDGKIIKTVDITKKGRGQVNVFANDLSNGLYMYSLIVDGKTIDTKKMVKQN